MAHFGIKKDRQHLDDAVSPMESVSFCSDDDRPVAQARGGADGRQEGRERGYYHLHRQLDDALFLHTIFVFFFRGMRLLGGAVARGTASPEAEGARLLCCGIVCP